MNEEVFESLESTLNSLEIKKGDILYIPSDITQLIFSLRKDFGIKTSEERNIFLDALINTIQNKVGQNGTLMFPVFTWDFNHGLVFDIRNTPGRVGSLPNWILEHRKDFIRTQHPMYSFMVWGKDAKLLSQMNNIDCWGEYSPFGYMNRNNAKALFFNVSIQRGFTFMHYVETALQVPYRYYKNFKGEYIDLDGNKSQRNYVMYVRDLKINMEEFNPDSFYENKGFLKTYKWNNLELKIMNCHNAYNAIKEDLLNNSGKNMYNFENYEIDWDGEHTHADEIDN